MAQQYTKVKHLLPEVLELVQEGSTQREIAEKFGLKKEHIRKLITRHNRTKRKAEEEIPEVKTRRGRPCKKPLTSTQELEQQVKRLEMENELLRSFLQAAGRR